MLLLILFSSPIFLFSKVHLLNNFEIYSFVIFLSDSNPPLSLSFLPLQIIAVDFG
jgi:hypothetical protein